MINKVKSNSIKLQQIDMDILNMIDRGCTNDYIRSKLKVSEARIKLLRHKRDMRVI